MQRICSFFDGRHSRDGLAMTGSREADFKAARAGFQD